MIETKNGKASKEFNNLGMYNVVDYVDAIKAVLTKKTDVVNAIAKWREKPTNTRKKKVLKTVKWYTGSKTDVNEELGNIRWKHEALSVFNENKQNRIFLVKVRAYLNAFMKTFPTKAEAEVSDTIYQSIAEYTKSTCKGQLGVEGITMEKLKLAYQQDLTTLFADGWSSASITNNTRQMEQALLVLFYCYAIHQKWCKKGKVNGRAVTVLKGMRKEAKRYTRKQQQKGGLLNINCFCTTQY